MKSLFIVTALCLGSIINTQAQKKFFTKTGSISFFSDAPLEKIEAQNKQVAAILQPETGDLVFKVLIKSFEFKQALMQEHFNENYMESDKFPESNFKGKILNLSAVNFTKDGTYDVEVEGKLTIHGTTNDIKTKGTIIVKEGGVKLEAKSKFSIKLKDYNIKNDKLQAQTLSENIDLTINCILSELKK